MSINKVTMNTPAGEQTLIDLTGDSVVPETLAKGATAHNAAGDLIEGKMPTETVLFTPQVLSQEEQAQARENIGAGLPPVLIDLDTYGEIPINLILGNLFVQGGGVMENVDIGNLMDALLTDSPLRVQFTFGVNVLYAYGVCVGRINNKAAQLTLNAMFTHQGKTYVAYASIDTPSADEDGKANISMSVEEPGEVQEFPVESVNGQTGAVQLSAADVGARPDDWMPTAQEVGALPSTYTPPNQTAEQVGADPKGTAASAVSQHNTANDSHNDIRLELKAINDRLTAFFDSDNQTLDELSEIVAYITSNKSLIDAITTSKVSVTDIINNLTTNVSNKPLSAAQGVVLKGLIDTLSGNLANYQPKGDYALRDELPAVPVKSVNGKTGDVSLTATDVKARPDNWMPTASDVGAVSSSQLPAAINTALEQAKESGQFDGDAGRGIKSIVRTSGTGAAGTTDTYTITYTDNTTSTISVYNGKDGTPGKTPAKGTDYFTAADKAEMVNAVIAALPVYKGEVL